MPELPFLLRRPMLLTRDIVVDRDRPDLERLSSIEQPERFVWAILPHAARTFSACIALLPKRSAKAAAVAYLYCRMLDTYEDLVVDADARDTALGDFAARFGSAAGAAPGPAPPIDGANAARDQRDASHLLLVDKHLLVDRVYMTLDADVRRLIRILVTDMSEGMRWSSAMFVRQAGVLIGEAQLARYCRGVLGHPVVFSSRLLHWRQTGSPDLPGEIEEQAMRVGEMIQLANITRDIEKDLQRGIAYHTLLLEDLGKTVAKPGTGGRTADGSTPLGSDGNESEAGVEERVRRVREELLIMALHRVPAYRPLIDFLSPRRFSLARASGVLMLLFTDRYFRSCARRAGLRPWGGRRSGVRLIFGALPAVWSRRWADRQLRGIERDFLDAAGRA